MNETTEIGHPTTKRWVQKNRQIYDFSSCLLCGAAYGICAGEPKVCRPTTCLACGSRQCMVNGLGRGTCGICTVGLLPGWSGTDRACSYKGCSHKAVARCDGKCLFRCLTHLERGKWLGYIERQLTNREKHFIEVTDDGPFPILGGSDAHT